MNKINLLKNFGEPMYPGPKMPEWIKYVLLIGGISVIMYPWTKSLVELRKQEEILATHMNYSMERNELAGYREGINMLEDEVMSDIRVAWPLGGIVKVTSGFGMRWNPTRHLYGGPPKKMHEGIDIAPEQRNNKSLSDGFVRAAADGIVESKKIDGDYGLKVDINHKGGFETRYAHLDWTYRKIRPGYRIKRGEKIGKYGNTGLTDGGLHLHFEIRDKSGEPIDPLEKDNERVVSGKELEDYISKRDMNLETIAQAKKDIRLEEIKKEAEYYYNLHEIEKANFLSFIFGK